jgi:glycolate oxidase iron-sulfur subunit
MVSDAQPAPGSAPAPAKGWKDLDYATVQQCMHCGLCLPTCPTYTATKLERNSPRGRISLVRAIMDGQMPLNREFAEEMYFCLGCLACTSACPAGVNYAEIFEQARAEAERSHLLRSPKRRFIRWLTVKWLFMDLRRLLLAGRCLRLYQRLGLQKLVRGSGVLRLFPKRLRELEAMTPDIPRKFSADLIQPVTPALGKRQYRVAVLTGCAQDLIFSEINRDTVEVLARNGCEVFTPPRQSCCGSLHGHNGEWELAKELARRQLDQFPPDQFDAIISNAGGCGSHLKHYHQLLKDDPVYDERARLWDARLKDIHEWLVEIGIQPVPSRNACEQVVTYHESCHLCHGQKVVSQPRKVLLAIPKLKLVELAESNWCCGSAGIYNIVQPKMANVLQERKMKNIEATRATVVANGNSGCLLQLINGARARKLQVRVAHPVTLLAEAYRRAEES